jgi:hypothetical protein
MRAWACVDAPLGVANTPPAMSARACRTPNNAITTTMVVNTALRCLNMLTKVKKFVTPRAVEMHDLDQR